MVDATTVIALAGGAAGLGGMAVQMYKARQEKRQLSAGTDQTVVGTAVDMAERLTATASSLLGPLQAQLQSAQAEVAGLRERMASLEAKFETTTREYEEAKHREHETADRARRLQRELEQLTAYFRTSVPDAERFLAGLRRQDDGPSYKAPPRDRIWTEEEREEYRRRATGS